MYFNMMKAEVRSYFLTVSERNQINYGCKTLIDGDNSTVVIRSLFKGHRALRCPYWIQLQCSNSST